MALITASEVNTLAFVNQLDPALILPQFIESAQTKYIVPVVTQDVLDLITATPENYTTLVDDYIKPYLAFSVKYMFYNQLLTETQLFAISNEQREDAINEIREICSIKLGLLQNYLNENIFAAPAVTSVTRISGFNINSADRVSNAASSVTVVTGVLGSASADTLSEEDSLNFIKYTASALRRITWTNFKAALRTYFSTLYAAITHNHDGAYATAAHNHDASYSVVSHNHDSAYASATHNHNSDYSPLGHDHNTAYSALGHNHDIAYAATGHNHDAAYAALSHHHDSAYLGINATAADSDKIDGKHIVVCTQAQYDALTPDANTLYFING